MSSQSKAEQQTGLTAADLRIYLLGPPRAEWAGRALAIPRRQVRALLYRLAARLDPVPREHLCFLFWPHTPESTARRNLSHLLTHLRNTLPTPKVLLAADDHVRLDPHRAWSDTAAFDRLCAGGGLRALQQAVDLYRKPFLAGFSLPNGPEFEAWATLEQRAWERLYLKALAGLIEEQTAGGNYDAAIAYARRYLEADDLAEDVHRRLITLYAATGDRSAALRQFERCAAVLERELGVSPLPETRAAYRAILDGRPPPLQRPVVESAWATLPGLDVPLVGRDGALRRLERAYARVRMGHGGVVLISGEAGIGKSRLMRDFATRLQGQALILVGVGMASERALPYQPIAQALRSTLNVERLTFNVQSTWLAEASRLLPELCALHPDLPPPMLAEPDEARARLFEALCRITLGLAVSPHPVLLCLDDLHWADGATLDWLVYMGRRLRGSRLLVIGAYRAEEADAVGELRRGLARLGVLSEMRLSGLDANAVLALLRHLEGHVPGDQALADRLQKATGGNPFFLLETLRVLIEAGRLPGDLADLEDLPLPDTVRQAVEARLERLSPVARQVLEAGAILGLTFGFDLVRLTAGRRELETMDGLDKLVARHLLVEQDTGYRFHHDLIRRVVEAGLSPMRRQLLHRRAGRALEQLEPGEVVALAYHFDAGGEGEKALHYHGLAAQRAEALFAWREAEGHQSRMLVLLDRLDPDCSEPICLAQRGQVLAARAHLRYLQGRLAERDTDLASLTALTKVSGDDRLRLQALAHRVRYLNLDGQHGEAITAAEEGLALADRLDHTPARSRFLAQIGLAHYFLGQPQPALTALESALTVAGEEANPGVRGRITRILGYVHLHLGDYTRALAYKQEAYTCHQAVGDHNRMAWDGLNIGFLHLKLGHFAAAERHLTESLALARQIGARPAQAYALTYLGYWELYRGQYAAAANRFRQALPEQQAVRSRHGMEAAEGGLGLALYHLGDLAEARHWLESAVERSRSLSHCRCLPEVLVGLGLVELADCHLLAAHRCLTEAVELARASECRENLAAGLAALAWVERQRGDPTGALAHAYKAVRVAKEIALPVCEMWGEMEAGLALLAQDEPAAALEHTRRAVTLVPQAHEGWIGTEQVHRAHARVLQALGLIGAADEQARRADAIIEAKAGRILNPE